MARPRDRQLKLIVGRHDTRAGAAVAEQARALLAGWQGQVNDARHRIGKTVALGTTEFTLRFVGTVWERVAEEFAAREVELNVVHVRTKDSFARLDAKEIDVLCGGFASVAGAGDIPVTMSSCSGGARGWSCSLTCPRGSSLSPR